MLSLFDQEERSIDKVRSDWTGCQKCFFSSMWKEYGPCLPSSNVTNKHVLVLGQWPGQQDMENKEPFSGKQGVVSREMVRRAGFNTEDIYYTNVLLCSTPLEPSKNILANCKDSFDQTLDVVQPRLIIAMGNLAMKRLGINGGLAGNRGKIFIYRGYKFVGSIHTAAIARQKDKQQKKELELEVMSDLKFALGTYRRIREDDRQSNNRAPAPLLQNEENRRNEDQA